MLLERVWQNSICASGNTGPAKGLRLLTFRENIAHAQDSHQVVNITVDALRDSGVLQDRMGEGSVETR